MALCGSGFLSSILAPISKPETKLEQLSRSPATLGQVAPALLVRVAVLGEFLLKLISIAAVIRVIEFGGSDSVRRVREARKPLSRTFLFSIRVPLQNSGQRFKKCVIVRNKVEH